MEREGQAEPHNAPRGPTSEVGHRFPLAIRARHKMARVHSRRSRALCSINKLRPTIDTHSSKRERRAREEFQKSQQSALITKTLEQPLLPLRPLYPACQSHWPLTCSCAVDQLCDCISHLAAFQYFLVQLAMGTDDEETRSQQSLYGRLGGCHPFRTLSSS